MSLQCSQLSAVAERRSPGLRQYAGKATRETHDAREAQISHGSETRFFVGMQIPYGTLVRPERGRGESMHRSCPPLLQPLSHLTEPWGGLLFPGSPWTPSSRSLGEGGEEEMGEGERGQRRSPPWVPAFLPDETSPVTQLHGDMAQAFDFGTDGCSTPPTGERVARLDWAAAAASFLALT